MPTMIRSGNKFSTPSILSVHPLYPSLSARNPVFPAEFSSLLLSGAQPQDKHPASGRRNPGPDTSQSQQTHQSMVILILLEAADPSRPMSPLCELSEASSYQSSWASTFSSVFVLPGIFSAGLFFHRGLASKYLNGLNAGGLGVGMCSRMRPLGGNRSYQVKTEKTRHDSSLFA